MREFFGVWDAPATDEAERVPAPIGVNCVWCRDVIRAGDNGGMDHSGFVHHRECSARAVMGGIGHHVDHDLYCTSMHDPDATLSYRESAKLVWRHIVDKVPVSREELADLVMQTKKLREGEAD